MENNAAEGNLYFPEGCLSLSTKFFSLIKVSDLDFTDQMSPTIYLGGFSQYCLYYSYRLTGLYRKRNINRRYIWFLKKCRLKKYFVIFDVTIKTIYFEQPVFQRVFILFIKWFQNYSETLRKSAWIGFISNW